MVATGNALAELAAGQDDGPRGVGPSRRRRAPRAHRGDGGAAPRAASRACSSRRACASSAAPAGSRARTRSRPTPTTAPRSSRPTRSCSSTGSRPRVPEWADDRRRAHPHHPPGVPAARDPRAPRRDRLGRHRRRVHAHVQRARLAGHARSSRASRCCPTKDPEVAAVLEDEFLRARREAAEGCARDRRSAARSDKVFIACDDGRAVDGSHALLVHRLGRPTPRASGCEAAGVEVDEPATSRATATARRTCRTSTRPATSRDACRCRRSRRCRAARSPST